MKKIFFLFLLLTAQFTTAQRRAIPVIFDSDMGPDYDDAGAIAILHTLADSGYAKILGTCASTKYEGVAAVFNVFNTYFGRPGIPVGIPKGNALTERDPQHWTDTIIARYPHKIKKNIDAPDAVKVYRKILARQPNRSVTIITVGFLTNLAGLLDSKADKYSPLTGRELVKKKVKRLVSMAGAFPKGREFNIFSDSAASKKVLSRWPTEIWFSGFEIGAKIKTGLPLIHNDLISNSPVKDVFSICIPMSKGDSAGRMSWDETAVLAAIKGCKPWFSLEKGKIIIENDGSNKWDSAGRGHSYLKLAAPVSEIQDELNRLMSR
jgi:inosine-uridine nucleoside N-ribohydrolase